MDNVLKKRIQSLPSLAMTGEEIADVYYQNASICLNDLQELVNYFEFAMVYGQIDDSLLSSNNQYRTSFSLPFRDARLVDHYYDLIICSTTIVVGSASRVISNNVTGTTVRAIPNILGDEIYEEQTVPLDDIMTALYIQLDHFKSMVAISKSVATFTSSDALISNIASQVQLLNISYDAEVMSKFISAQTAGMSSKDEMVLLSKITSNYAFETNYDSVAPFIMVAIRNGTYTSSTPLALMGGLVGDSISSILGSIAGGILNVISTTLNILGSAIFSLFGLVSSAYNYLAKPPLITKAYDNGDGSILESSYPVTISISNLRSAFPGVEWDFGDIHNKVKELILPGLRVFITSNGDNIKMIYKVQPTSCTEAFRSSSNISLPYAPSSEALFDTIENFYSKNFDPQSFVKLDGSEATLSEANNTANAIWASTQHGINVAIALLSTLDDADITDIYDYTSLIGAWPSSSDVSWFMASRFNDQVTATAINVLEDLKFSHQTGGFGNVTLVSYGASDGVIYDDNISTSSVLKDIISATDIHGRYPLILLLLFINDSKFRVNSVYLTRFVNSIPVSSFRFFNLSDAMGRAKTALSALGGAVLLTVATTAFIAAKSAYNSIVATSQANYIQAINDYNQGNITSTQLATYKRNFERLSANNNNGTFGSGFIPLFGALNDSSSQINKIGKLIDSKF